MLRMHGLCYLGCDRLPDNQWDDLPKTSNGVVSFFTNWTNSTELPEVYGSGVIIPSLDYHYNFIIYVTYQNLWFSQMHILDDGTYQVNDWHKVAYT